MLKLVDKLTLEEIEKMASKQPKRLSLQLRAEFARGVKAWREEHHRPLIIGRIEAIPSNG